MGGQTLYLSILCLLVAFSSAFPQGGRPASGSMPVTVMDDTGEPLIGVIVTSPEENFQTTTDLDGQVDLGSLSYHSTVQFDYLGFVSLTLKVTEIRKKGARLTMQLAQNELAEIVVIGRTDQSEAELPYQIELIDREKLQQVQSQNAADALSKSGEAFVQKSQMGGGSPILRGFEANRILLVVDGVRLNNAIYRSGHLQNAITVDPHAINRLELIQGPGSLMYGSDALGGVLHFRTMDPKIAAKGDDPSASLGALVRFSSANQEKTANIQFMNSGTKVGSYTSISFSDYGDLRAGANRPEAYPDFGKRPFYLVRTATADEVRINDDENLQRGTAYRQFDIIQKLKFRPNLNWEIDANIQFSTTGNVPRYDQLSITRDKPNRFKFAEWYYGPQTRGMFSLKNRWLGNHIFDKATLINYYQRVHEDRITRKFTHVRRSYNLERVNVYGVNFDAEKNLGTFRIQYGGEWQSNAVYSQAGRIDINSGYTYQDIPTRYPSDKGVMSSLGAYGIVSWQSADSMWMAQVGGRYSGTTLIAKYDTTDVIQWPDNFYEGIQSKNQSPTWTSGLTFNHPSGVFVKALLGTAFRSPNLDDFGKIREKNGFISVPNIELMPEYIFNSEITAGFWINRHHQNSPLSVRFSGTYWHTIINDAIIVDKHPAPNGASFIDNDGEILETQAGFNAESGEIKGYSLLLELQLKDYFSLDGRYTKMTGESTLEDQIIPLAHIPPGYGRLAANTTLGPFHCSLQYLFNQSKPVSEYGPGTSDNLDDATPDGSYSWGIWSAFLKCQFKNGYSIESGVENIADLHYRTFSSGVSAPGRNFILAFRKEISN